jgi:hypothetical protein
MTDQSGASQILRLVVVEEIRHQQQRLHENDERGAVVTERHLQPPVPAFAAIARELVHELDE